MAWRSSGTTNDEMVDNLKRFGVISMELIERGFRNVDRKYFVPKGHEDVAHTDQPLKEGNVHISAPHIYGSALESLELVPNSSMSFLNVGSGTGYVSCIVADILGPRSLNYGIEIHEDVVEHSKAAIEKWKSARDGQSKAGGTLQPHIEIIHGNALNISTNSGEPLVGFDRIYIGAAVEHSSLSKLTKLLRPGGVLVGPVDDELVKVVRIGAADSSAPDDMIDTGSSSNDFTQQVLSGVRFAPLLSLPLLETVIPSKVWEPAMHQYYPSSFRKSSMVLMLCNNADYVQPPPRPQAPENRTNLAAMLPPAIWMEILSFTHRNWFEQPPSEAAFLRKRLMEEQASAQKAQKARLEAEARLHIAIRERDVYRLLARRWQSRLQALVQQRNQSSSGNSAEAQAEETVSFSGHEHAAIFGLGAMLRHLHGDDDDDDDEELGDNEEMVTENRNNSMEEDMEHDAEVAEGDSTAMIHESEDEDFSSDVDEEASSDMDDGDDLGISLTQSKAMVVRRQVRAVSMASDDI